MTRRHLGSKVEIEPGKWRLSVSAGFDPVSGKRRRPSETYYGNERDAEIRLNQMLAETGRAGSTAITLWAFIETMYLPAIAPPELRKRTVDEYRKKLERYVKPSGIASVRLNRLDRYTMVSWMRGVKQQVPNKQTQLHIYSALSAALGKAVMWGYLDENPLRKAVEPPVPDEYVPAVLTEAEMNDHLNAFIDDPLEPLVVLGLQGGLRPSETYAVTVARVDFEEGGVWVLETRHQRDGQVWTEDAKNSGSRRFVPLPDEAMERLATHCRGRIGLLFGDLTPDQIAYRYKVRVQELGLTWCPIENMRHTHLTILSEQGAAWNDLQKRAGHTSAKMLEKRYVKRHLLRDRRLADLMGSLRQLPPSATSAPGGANTNA